ncbi:MAG: hypothetical protein ACKVT0_12895 [Planctomycetaceae bacterium]
MKAYPLSAEEVLDQMFLDIRAKILEVAAGFDRIERADESQTIGAQLRWKQLQGAARLLTEANRNRAEQVQLLFSDPYNPQWDKPKPAVRA